MAGSKLALVVVVMMIASLQLQGTAAPTRHVVGDAMGWTFPSGDAAAYTTWASKQTFAVGDTLLFNFTTGVHSVAEVSQAAYEACSATKTLSLNYDGPATLRLNSTGKHYYICTVISHCLMGQKFSINVSPGTATGTPTTGATPPSAFDFSPAGSRVPPLATSAAPSFATVVPVTLLAAALAFFY